MCSSRISTSGWRAATSRTISSQNGSVWTMPLDFVALVRPPPRRSASSNAYSAMRVTPRRVKIASWTAISCAWPR